MGKSKKNRQSTSSNITETNEYVVTVHGGPSVQYIPMEKWPSIDDWLSKIDTNWPKYNKNNKKWRNLIDKQLSITYEKARRAFTEIIVMIPKFKPGDIRVRLHVNTDGTVLTNIIQAEHAAGPDTYESINIRYDPIGRRYEMSEFFNKYNIDIQGMKNDPNIRAHILINFQEVLKRYKLVMDINEFDNLWCMYVNYDRSVYDTTIAWCWVTLGIYPIIMKCIMCNSNITSHAKDALMTIHKRIVSVAGVMDHHPELQLEVRNAYQITIEYSGCVNTPRTVRDLILREKLLMIHGNMQALLSGFINTIDDHKHAEFMQLDEWKLLTKKYVPPKNYYTPLYKRKKEGKKKEKK